MPFSNLRARALFSFRFNHFAEATLVGGERGQGVRVNSVDNIMSTRTCEQHATASYLRVRHRHDVVAACRFFM
jgi:hypothetical protein